MTHHPIVELTLSLLTHGTAETYLLSDVAAARVEAALGVETDGMGAAARALGELAWMLETKLASPSAARQVLALLARSTPRFVKERTRQTLLRPRISSAHGQRLASFEGRRTAQARSPQPGTLGTMMVRDMLARQRLR